MSDFLDALRDNAISEIVGGVFALVAAGLGAYAMRDRKRVTLDERKGRTIPDQILIVVGAVALLIALAAAGTLLFAPPADPSERLAARLLMIAFLGIVAITAIFGAHRWSWSCDGIAQHFVFRRVRIPWREVARAGLGWDGSWFVKDARGRKVWWTRYTLGWETLNAAVRRHRPDLAQSFPG